MQPESPSLDQGQIAVFYQRHRTGLVSLVFTDLVDSTALMRQLGDQAGTTFLQQRRQIVRQTLKEFPDGEEIETAGDSFLLIFAKPSDAVRFALLVQARFRAFRHEKQVGLLERIGIHLGEVVIKEHETEAKAKDLYGIQIGACARVMSLAQGGQVLMTRGVFDSARQVLKGEDIPGVGRLAWVSHGPYLLKGIEEPVEVCEVGEVGQSPLTAPKTTEKAERYVTAEGEPVLGWRPAIGQEVPNTKWVLEQKLGEGGFGEVWLGRHQTMKERRVFKFCFRADRARSLKREMTLFRLIKERIGDHPNIVSLREVYFDEPPYYVEMDYVAGQDLKAWSEERGGVGNVPLEVKLEIVAQVADALQAAHDAGVIHRDVKPANILVSGKWQVASGECSEVRDQKAEDGGRKTEGRGQTSEVGGQWSVVSGQESSLASRLSPLLVKLTDFGIGQVVSEEYLSGVTKAGFTQTILTDSSSSKTGTQLYMAPELLSGKPASIRSDIYSLGVVLYQLLTNDFTRPVTTDWAEQISDSLLREDLKRCFAGDPQARFSAAGQLAHQLRSLPERRTELERQAAEKVALERAAYRRGVIRTSLSAALLVLLFAVLSLLALRESHRAKQADAATKLQRDIAQGRLYAAQMKLVHAAFKNGKTGGALELLKAQRPLSGQPDFRGFDWRYLYDLCLSSPSEMLATNASGFLSVDYSPDGRQIALGAGDGYAELLDAQTRQSIKRWPAHKGPIDYLAFYPKNNNWLGTVSGVDGILKLWDIANKRTLISTNTAQGMMVDFAFSPDGRFLATRATNSASVDLWEFHSRTPDSMPALTLMTNLKFAGPAVFSTDNRTMAVCNQIEPQMLPNVALYDMVEGVLSILSGVHDDFISAATFSRDGRTLATGSADECVFLWNVQRRTTNYTLWSDLICVTAVAFAPDGRTLFAGGYDQNLRSWQVENPTRMNLLRGHSAGVNRFAIAPDGRSLASAGSDGNVRLWNLKTSELTSAVDLREEYTTLFPLSDMSLPEDQLEKFFGLAVSPSGDQVAAVQDTRLILCSLRTGTVLTNVAITNVFSFTVKPCMFGRLTYSPDGRELAVGSDDGRITFLDAVTLWPLRETLQFHSNQITHIAYALNGTVLVTGGGFGAGIWLIDRASGRVITNFSGVEGSVPMQPLAVSHDGKRLATGSPEGWVRVRDIATRRIVASSTNKVRFLTEVAFAPDGKLLAFADEQSAIYLWDSSGHRPLRKLVGHSGVANVLAFSPDGRTLASGGMDHTIRLWHPEIDQEVAILKGHSGWIWCVAFADNGNALLSCSRDRTLKLWRAQSFDDIDTAERTKTRRP